MDVQQQKTKNLPSSNSGLRKQYDESVQKNKELETKLKLKESELDQERKKIGQMSRFLEQEQTLEQFEESIQKIESSQSPDSNPNQNDGGEEQFNDFNQRNQLFQERIKEKDRQIKVQYHALNQQNENKNQPVDRCLAAQNNKVYNLKEEIKQYQKNNQELQNKLKEKDIKIEKEKEAQKRMYRQFTNSDGDEEFNYFEEQIKQKEEENQFLNQQIDEKKQQADRQVNQISQLKQKLQQSLEENKFLKDEVREKENSLEKEKQANIQLQRNLEITKQQQIKQQEESAQKIGQQADSLANQNCELKKLTQKNQDLDKKAQEQQAQLEKEKQVNTQLNNDLETVKSQQEESASKMQQQNNNLGNQINELKKQNEQTLQENKQLQEKVKEQQTQLEKERSIKAQLSKDLQIVKQQSIKQQEKSIQKVLDSLSFDQNLQKGDELNQQIKCVLTKLNPNTEIRADQVEFAKVHQTVQQNQPDEKQKSAFKVKNDQLVQSYKQTLQSNQQNNSSNQDPSGMMQCLLALQDMYYQEGIQTFITDQPISNLEKEDKSYQIQQDLLQTGQHLQASYYSLQMNKETDLYQDLLVSSANENIISFTETFKNKIGKSVNSQNPQTDVVILKIDFGQDPKVDFQINSNDLSKKEIQKKLTLADLGVSVSERSLLEFAKLSIEMFNPKYNMTWTDKHKDRHESRGQLKFFDQVNPVDHCYNFPIGYTGYALNVERYGADKSWISSNADDKTWIVLFHGTTENAISGITKNNLLPGKNNWYGGRQCRITNTTIKTGQSNIYLTDSMEVAERYAHQSSIYEGNTYQIVFQCRVNPKGVKSPKDKPTYYTVEDNANIRPYRILLKVKKSPDIQS